MSGYWPVVIEKCVQNRFIQHIDKLEVKLNRMSQIICCLFQTMLKTIFIYNFDDLCRMTSTKEIYLKYINVSLAYFVKSSICLGTKSVVLFDGPKLNPVLKSTCCCNISAYLSRYGYKGLVCSSMVTLSWCSSYKIKIQNTCNMKKII